MKEHFKILFKHNAFEEESIEGAWATKDSLGYKLDNILFYAKEYSLNDIIEVEEIDGELFANRLVKENGHSTIRVLLGDPSGVSRLREVLETMGCASELSNFDRLVAIDIPPEVNYKDIQNFLDDGMQQELWEY